jgi:hypothetical protein
MGGWLVQVPVKRFGTEALVHLYAVWMPDHTDALARAGLIQRPRRSECGEMHASSIACFAN